jgi:hypothetical protein
LLDLPAGMSLQSVVAAGVGSEIADPGLARRSASIGAEVGKGVIKLDLTTDCGGVGEHPPFTLIYHVPPSRQPYAGL